MRPIVTMAMVEQAEGARRTKKSRALSPAQSRRRSEITRRVRPWLAAMGRHTGPRSAAGKARSRMNARRHGRCDARSRAIDAFLTTFGRMTQCLDVLSSARSGVPYKPSHFLNNATVRTLETTIAQLKNELPDADSHDTGEWTRWLAEHRRLGEAPPDGLGAEAADVPLLVACGVWWETA